MFFGRRKKEAKELRNMTERVDVRLWFDQQIKVVELTSSPDEKLIRLAEIGEQIDARIAERNSGNLKQAKKHGTKASLFGDVTVGVLAVGGMPFTGGWSILLLVPGPVGTGLAGQKLAQTKYKALEKESAEYLAALEMQRVVISEMQNKVMDEHLEDVAKSPRRQEMFSRFPDMKARFAEAAAKRLAEDRKPPANDDAPPFKSPFDNGA